MAVRVVSIMLDLRTRITYQAQNTVTKYLVRVEFGLGGPNISEIFGPAGLKYSTISGSGN